MKLVENASYRSKKQLAMLKVNCSVVWKERFAKEPKYIEMLCGILEKFRSVDTLTFEEQLTDFSFSKLEREMIENLNSLIFVVNDYAYKNFISPFKDDKNKCACFFIMYNNKYIKLSWSDWKIDVGQYVWYKAEIIPTCDIKIKHFISFKDIIQRQDDEHLDNKLKSLSKFSEVVNKALVDGVPSSRIVEELITTLENWNNNT